MTTLTSAEGVTVVNTGGVTLFKTFVSPVGEPALATFVSATLITGAVTVRVRFVACNADIVPRFHVTTPLAFEPLPLALKNVTPTGSVSVTNTPAALDGPRFVTLIV